MEHAFGPGLRNFPDLAVHGTADEVLAHWENSRRPVDVVARLTGHRPRTFAAFARELRAAA